MTAYFTILPQKEPVRRNRRIIGNPLFIICWDNKLPGFCSSVLNWTGIKMTTPSTIHKTDDTGLTEKNYSKINEGVHTRTIWGLHSFHTDVVADQTMRIMQATLLLLDSIRWENAIGWRRWVEYLRIATSAYFLRKPKQTKTIFIPLVKNIPLISHTPNEGRERNGGGNGSQVKWNNEWTSSAI